MTKENCVKLVEYYKKVGKVKEAEDVKDSYKRTYGEELEKSKK